MPDEAPKMTLEQLREIIREEVTRNQGPSALDQAGDIARGAVKSWSMWFGALLMAWPEIQPMLSEALIPIIGQSKWDTLIRLAGVAVILLRIKTTQSIAAKGRT